MCEITLQLPSGYVDMEREEMEYVDGGYTWWKRAFVVAALAAALTVVLAYGELWTYGTILKATVTWIAADMGTTPLVGLIASSLGISAGAVWAIFNY